MNKTNNQIIMEGQTVSLVKPSINHFDEFVKKSTLSKNLHGNWTSSPKSIEEFTAYIERTQKENQFGALIIKNQTSEIVGVVNISEIVMGLFKSGYLGYYLFSEYDKQGLMTEALRLMLKYAFNHANLHRLEANIQPGNIDSLRLVHRAGFIREGLSKNYLRINGQWQDHVRYAITKEVYESQGKQTDLAISLLKQEQINEMVKQFSKANLNKDVSLFNTYLDEQSQGKRLTWVSVLNKNYVGYISLVWQSSYKPFCEKGIPEIKDLNVAHAYRKNGIGTSLLLTAEKEAFKRSKTIGLGVGLYSDYGNAQNLYIKLGYKPDGNGITYNYEIIPPGKTTCLDDDLCLWLVKHL